MPTQRNFIVSPSSHKAGLVPGQPDLGWSESTQPKQGLGRQLRPSRESVAAGSRDVKDSVQPPPRVELM